ncbi:MAG: hypothetical protein QOJ94_997 [Sphingomonadales bacterium]|jgi:integrase|nr:hypothetical protein [Sphingomonadales bacterium]
MTSQPNRAKLTKGYVDRIKPGPKDAFHWDTEVKGFALRVTPTGKTTFVVQGRVEGSDKEARITIGSYGVFTVDQARDVAREHLRTMRMGSDPRDLKRQDEAMKVTLGTVCAAYVERPGKLKKSTRDEYQRQVDKVFAAWKDKPIVSITEDEVRKRHRELVEKGLEGKKAAPASANSAMVTLRILCNFASRQFRRADGSPLIQHNPVGVLRDHWAKLGSRTDRYIDRRKIGEVWNKLVEARDTPKNRDHLSAIDLTIFALLTGARRDEMACLTWDRVNIDDHDPANCWWHLDDRKRGDPIWLPLSSQAVALLKLRPRLKLADGTESPWVFPSWSKTGHITDARAPMELVSATVGKHLSLHDMRRTFSNVAMRECLIEKFRTDLLTGHKPAQEDVTARNYLDLAHLDWLQPEVQKIGDWLEQQARVAEAMAASKNVLPLAA